MTYLSRLALNLRTREVRRDLADCQQLHRTIMSAFPQAGEAEPARERFAVLFRLETERAGNALVLVQSCEAPDWSRLPPGYTLDTPACKSVDRAYDSLSTARAYVFRLRANPTRKINTRSGPSGERHNGARVELHGEEEWLAWLRRKGEQYGFQLLTVRAAPIVDRALVDDARASHEGRIVGTRAVARGANGQARLTLFPVLFEGRLAVTDTARFREGLLRGIGPGKAFGLGLLSVAPASAANTTAAGKGVP
jgi:CRISPR system Cascade subunit CasE